MPAVSAHAAAMQHSGIRALMELALVTPDAIRLEVGQPNVPTPAHVLAAAHAGALAGHTEYTSSIGAWDLREALAAKVRRVNGIDVGPERIIATHGAMSGLASASLALLAPGDELLVPDPEFPNWAMAATAAGAATRYYPCRAERGFVPALDEIEASITDATRVLLVNSPNNPTGAVYPAELLEGMVELARRHDLWLFSDECYEAITFDGVPHVSPATFDTDERVLTFFSFSKTYSMTGWRLGYAVLPERLVDLFSQLSEALLACPSSVSQRAALAALDGPQDDVAAAVDGYRTSRDAAVELLGARGVHCVVPRGAFYLMVDVSPATADTDAFARRLLAERGVAVAPGSAFGAGGAGMVRVSLATERGALLEGLGRLADLVHGWDKPAPRA